MVSCQRAIYIAETIGVFHMQKVLVRRTLTWNVLVLLHKSALFGSHCLACCGKCCGDVRNVCMQGVAITSNAGRGDGNGVHADDGYGVDAEGDDSSTDEAAPKAKKGKTDALKAKGGKRSFKNSRGASASFFDDLICGISH
jgi:hypothetical protein